MLILGGLVFDYYVNSRTVSVTLHKVKAYSLQEKFTVSGEIYHENNVNYIKSTIRSPLHIKEGAYAGVTIDGEYYDGYLRDLEKLTQGTEIACISVVSEKELSGNAEAEVYGGIAENVVIIPKDCIFRDENNNEAVMIASDGYCVKRNVTVGEIENSKGVQIKKGLFPDENIVVNHTDVKTGDKYK